MLSNLIKKSKIQKGFTIIEVMIVLAIAGLILVVVLIAIPQLQRNQRNSARQSVLSRMVTELSNYAGNNNGKIPTTAVELDAVYNRYLGCGDAADATDALTLVTCTLNIEDPSTGTAYIMTIPANGVTGVPTVPTVQGEIYYQLSSKCDGESISTGSARNFAMWALLEGGAYYCLDNS